MSYNRKIFYMSFYEGDEKRGNAGYIKVLEDRDVQNAEVRLNGLSAMYDGAHELEIVSGEAEPVREKIYLQAGNGSASCNWEKRGELSLLSFRVLLPGGCSLDSRERVRTYRTEPLALEAPLPEIIEESEETALEMQELLPERAEEQVEEGPKRTEKQGDDKDKVENRKWKQICKVYPHIQPFQDFRDYIKLELKDMVLISEKKYTLVENSFLLHGYYNYDHIILWKKEKAPVKYYIGVPGNFYEKEKQVAVLYGFESFEGAVEPAGEGDFGYYMTEVTI